METAKISAQGQITVPKKYREKLGVTGGDELEFVDYGTHIGIIKKTSDMSDIAGIGANWTTVKLTIEEMNEALGNDSWEPGQ